ncbi:MAG: hypothetical protein II428_01960 [Muribaculaceae bacterium]|jgi:hypothetical protein|nr:hypothetical protein [Muribaculaceae bacterium]MBQ4006276.1 hypothetical protein [Muribaculaceae bacterium]
MKKLLLLVVAMLTFGLASHAQDVKTYENKAFSIDYPADWNVTWDGDTYMNMESADGKITFNICFNEQGPMKSQLKQAVDNWVSMQEGQGHKVDQKMVKEDYALVRSIATDEDDGEQTVSVWFIMISTEPQGFSGSIDCGIEHANEALDTLVALLATLSPK